MRTAVFVGTLKEANYWFPGMIRHHIIVLSETASNVGDVRGLVWCKGANAVIRPTLLAALVEQMGEQKAVIDVQIKVFAQRTVLMDTIVAPSCKMQLRKSNGAIEGIEKPCIVVEDIKAHEQFTGGLESGLAAMKRSGERIFLDVSRVPADMAFMLKSIGWHLVPTDKGAYFSTEQVQ